MIIQRFTQFILKRRFNAILIAILFALVPYLNWVSGIVVGLITLRKGVTEGFMITLWAALPGLVILFHTGLWVPFVANVAYGTFLVWILAILLRRTANWSLVLCLTALLGVVGVLVMHLAVKNVSAWWFQYFNFSLTQLEQVVSIPASAESNMTIMLQKLSVVATGLQIMFFSLAAIIVLFMARGLEDRFFKPGCLAQEAYQIRMPILASLVFIGWLFLGRQEAGFFLYYFNSCYFGSKKTSKGMVYWFLYCAHFYSFFYASVIIDSGNDGII